MLPDIFEMAENTAERYIVPDGVICFICDEITENPLMSSGSIFAKPICEKCFEEFYEEKND